MRLQSIQGLAVIPADAVPHAPTTTISVTADDEDSP